MNRISFAAKLTYGMGSMLYAVKDAAFGMFVLLYYTQVLGLSGSLTGLAIFLSVLWDAVSDPMVGAWSDRLETSWGRRHPMMIAATLPLGLSFVMLFHPIDAVIGTQGPLFLWLLGSVLLLRTFLTVFIIPHSAMGAEITDDYEERTSIVSFRTNLGWIAGTTLPALSLAAFFGSTDGQDGRFIVENYHYYGWASFCVVLVAGAISILGSRQFIPRLIEVASRGAPTPGFLGMVRDTLDTLKNANFRRIIVFEIAVGGTMGILGALNMIAWTYFWELTVEQIAILSVAALLAVAMMFPGMSRLSQRFEKQALLKISVIGLVINTAWFVPSRLLGWLPENGTQLLFALVFIQWMISAALMILRTVSLHSIMADLADEYELQTGRRQEGVFFAAAAFALKFVMGFGYVIGGPLLDFVGLQAGVAPGDASPEALLGIGIAIGPMIALLLLVPWWMTSQIDVSRAGLKAVHDELGFGESAPAADS
jgi:GPH family glycoside/pentoside/hexuronide:cation symporter